MSIKRRAGEATNAHERDLERAVGRVPQWRNSGFRYAALVGGLTNQNWIVEVDGEPRRYFIKVPGEGSEMFIDRVVANEAARNAHAMELAPEVVFFDPQDGLEVSEFLEGYRACTNADFGDPSIQSDVLSLYRRLHSGPSLGLTKTIFDMIEEHFQQGRDLGSHFPPDMPWIEHRYRQAKAAFMASGYCDLVVEASLKSFDFMALVPVVEGAGGVMRDWEGRRLNPMSDGRVIAAANERLLDQALAALGSGG